MLTPRDSDNGLREKVDVQVDAFRDTLNALLDDQFHRVNHLIRFSADLDSGEVSCCFLSHFMRTRYLYTQCTEGLTEYVLL